MLVIELLHAGLHSGQSIECLAAAGRIGIRRLAGGRPRRRTNMRDALPLNAIELGIQRADLHAEPLLFGDSSLESIDIQGYDVGSRSSQGCGKRAKQSEALFQQFEIACGLSTHNLGPFIQLMFLLFV